MRNILEKVRKRDYDEVKADAQAIYRAPAGAKPKLRSAAFIATGTALTQVSRIG